MLISEAGECVLAGAQSWNEYPRPQLKRGNWRVLQNGWTLDGDKIRVLLPYDITDVLEQDNVLKVQVTDALLHKYSYGKQRKKRGGMWYTAVSGIWQQV